MQSKRLSPRTLVHWRRMSAGALAALFSACLLAVPALSQSLPDLIVTDVQMIPAAPYAGDTVRFQMTVGNQGTAPTPPGVVIGGIFMLNGQVIAYEDKDATALAPGGSVVVMSNGGGANADGTWVAQAGTFTLSAYIDDVNRIKESNESNNGYTNPNPITIIVKSGADLIVSDVKFSPKRVGPRTPILFKAEVTNIGNVMTPGNIPITMQFMVDGNVVSENNYLKTSLAPGDSIWIKGLDSSGGPDPFWIASPGDHAVQATVNYDNSQTELRTDNNTRTIMLTIDRKLDEKAAASDSFVDSIGVNTHLNYFDTTYYFYSQVVKARLLEAGIRHIRDASYAGSSANANFVDLGTVGVNSTQITNPRLSVSDNLSLIRQFAPYVDGIEGPNEPNSDYPDLFPTGIQTFQALLYSSVKADNQLRTVPVLSPALAFAAEAAVNGALGAVPCDEGAIHPYQAGQLPDYLLTDLIASLAVTCPGKPAVATETGYHTAINNTVGQLPVSETAVGKYIPRLYFDFFNAGIKRTFVYELLDEKTDPLRSDQEQAFGMIRTDNTPKPSFTAVKNIIHLLQEPSASFKPSTLAYQISGDTTALRHLLLQKSDGTYYLALWVNDRSFDASSKTDIVNPYQVLNINFNRRFGSIQVYHPVSSPTAIRSTSGRQVQVNALDELVILELR